VCIIKIKTLLFLSVYNVRISAKAYKNNNKKGDCIRNRIIFFSYLLSKKYNLQYKKKKQKSLIYSLKFLIHNSLNPKHFFLALFYLSFGHLFTFRVNSFSLLLFCQFVSSCCCVQILIFVV